MVEPPALRYKEGSTVVPGDRIGTIRQALPGQGTYVKGGHIYASLVGQLKLVNIRKKDDEAEQTEETTAPSASSSISFACTVTTELPSATAQVLKIGQMVVGRVVRITPQNAIVEIKVAEHVGPLQNGSNSCYYEGAIRMEDIRAGATEQILLADCFRPGDIVACRIISLGDPRRYFLSTAETELGVIRATTAKGVPMIPISWKEMECPETGIREPRKCAKPILLS
mmetsp:Transcript_1326/g.2065  ORF Transcript_1326/g.2065 Transcript_1326/m.2065 type:complete len:226 (+) Transcript_1326:91-768(+)